MPDSVIVFSVLADFAEPDIRDRYVEWLRDGHCLALVREGGALSAEVTVLDSGAVEVRSLFASRSDFDAYEAGPALALHAERERHFPPGPSVQIVRTVGTRAARIPD